MCVYAYISTTKNLNYLIIKFSRYFFLFLYNVLSFIKAIPLDLNRIYIIFFKFTLKSLRAFILCCVNIYP